jgi:hypothetical protein
MKVLFLATLVLAADTLEYMSGGVINIVDFFIQVLLKPLAF